MCHFLEDVFAIVHIEIIRVILRVNVHTESTIPNGVHSQPLEIPTKSLFIKLPWKAKITDTLSQFTW